jgi:predicted PurR-regulated permease PerM
VGTIAAVVPPMVTETAKLINQIPIPPALAENINNYHLDTATLNTLAGQLDSIPKVLGMIGSTVGFFAVLIIMIVMSFYLLKERPRLHKNLIWLFGRTQTERQAELFVDRIEHQIGGWVRGEFALMLIVGLLTYLGLLLLNVSYALPLAIMAGLLEILPSIGPTLSAIPAVIIAFLTTSPTMAVAVLALYVLVQQLENSLIVPIVMKRAVGINPLATIVLILIGLRLGGIGGAALAIPLFLSGQVIFKEYRRFKPKA